MVLIGGVSVTSTAIESRHMDIQNLRGQDTLKIGGRLIEANYQLWCPKDVNVQERDILSSDSGTTNYEVMFVEDLWIDHLELFAKKVS